MENLTLQQKIECVAGLWSFGPMDARCEAERMGLTAEQFRQAVKLNEDRRDEAAAHYHTTGRGLPMARPKKVTFADSLDIWLETAQEQEIRDAITAAGTWARVRKFGFKIRIEEVKKEESNAGN